jgi:hypothetical protein
LDKRIAAKSSAHAAGRADLLETFFRVKECGKAVPGNIKRRRRIRIILQR